MAEEPIQFPLRTSLSSTMRDFVDLIQTQFQITYPSMPLAASPQFLQNPSLIDIIKIVLFVVQNLTSCGPSGATLLGRWLGVMQDIDIASINLQALLEDHSVLKELYTRGIANYSTAQLSLRQTFRVVEHMDIATGVTRIHIPGEHKKIFLITTPAISSTSLYTFFCVNPPQQSIFHECRLRLHTHDGPNIHPMRILIVNAGGIRNPAFMAALTDHCNRFNPHFALVTETRVGGIEGRLARISTNFPAATYLEPVGNFGGVWLLWNLRMLRLQLIIRTDRSLVSELDPVM